MTSRHHLYVQTKSATSSRFTYGSVRWKKYRPHNPDKGNPSRLFWCELPDFWDIGCRTIERNAFAKLNSNVFSTNLDLLKIIHRSFCEQLSRRDYLWKCQLKYANGDLNFKDRRIRCENFLKPIMMSKAVSSLPSDPLWCVASDPKDVLGCGGRLLHGGVDRHLHVSVQKCVRAVQTDHGHVRRRVSFCAFTLVDLSLLFLFRLFCEYVNCACRWILSEQLKILLHLSKFSVFVTWVWNGTTQWSCLHVSSFLLPSYWLVSSSCTISTQTSLYSLTSKTYLSDRCPGDRMSYSIKIVLALCSGVVFSWTL